MKRQGINVRAGNELYPPRGWWHGGVHPQYEPAYIQPVIDHTNHGNQLPQVPRERLVDFMLGETVEVPGRLQRPSCRGSVQFDTVEFFNPPEVLPPGGSISQLEEDGLPWHGDYVDLEDGENLFEVPGELLALEFALGTEGSAFYGSTQEIRIGGFAIQPEFVAEEVAPISSIIR